MQLIIDLLDWLTPYGLYSYVIMFGILLACGFGLPMPEDIILVTGGVLAARGVTDFSATIVVTLIGVLLGDGIIFFLGRKYGPHIKTFPGFKKILTDKNDKKVREIFNKYGDKVIFVARFTPGLRMPLFLSAGIYQVSWFKFITLDGFAAFISVPLWVYLGYIFGANLELLNDKVHHFQYGIYSILGLLAIFAFIKLRKSKKAS